MLFVFIIIAFFQMTLIPGFLVATHLRIIPTFSIQFFLYIFAFSLIFNSLFVFTLTLFHLFVPIAVYILLLIEAILLIYYFYPSQKRKITLDFSSLFQSVRTFFKTNSWLYILLFIATLVCCLVFIKYAITRFKEVFYLNDAVLSWNRFALDWYHNRFPTEAWFYPQIISSNWALAYNIMGSPQIQFVARNIMIFFSLGTLALFIDLGLRKKNSFYFIAAIFYSIIMNYLFLPDFLTEGYVDIPVSFFGFLAFYVMHIREEISSFDIRASLLSITFASAAAATKQAGLYILIFVLVWNVFLLTKNKAQFTRKSILKIAIAIFLIISTIVFSWYGNRIINIAQGHEKAGIKIVTQDVHKNRTMIERFQYGFQRILDAKGKKSSPVSSLYVTGILLLLGLFHKSSRNLTLFLVIPFIILWGFFFSYDYRNLTLAIPFIAFSSAFGLAFPVRLINTVLQKTAFGKKFLELNKSFDGVKGAVFQKSPLENSIKSQTSTINSSRKLFSSINLSIPIIFLLFLISIIVLNFTLFKPPAIIDNQVTQLKKIGNEGLNIQLYSYFDSHGIDGKVFSKYPFFRFLPHLGEYWVSERDSNGVEYFLEDYSVTNKEILKAIKEKLKTREYQVIFRLNQYRLIKLNNQVSVPQGN